MRKESKYNNKTRVAIDNISNGKHSELARKLNIKYQTLFNAIANDRITYELMGRIITIVKPSGEVLEQLLNCVGDKNE